MLLDPASCRFRSRRRVFLEAPGGLIEVRQFAAAARPALSVNLASFVAKLMRLEVQGLGTLTVDTAYGGNSFVIVDAAALGFAIAPDEARDIAETGVRSSPPPMSSSASPIPRLSAGTTSPFASSRPADAEAKRTSGPERGGRPPGKIDRSPTGTGCSARIAALSARGQTTEGDVYRARSIIGSEFVCRITRQTTIGGRPAIIPIVSGRAWITGVNQYMVDPARSASFGLPARGHLAAY